MNRLQKLCILICVFSPFVIFGSYASGAPIDDLILYWGVFVTSFVGIFLFRENLLPQRARRSRKQAVSVRQNRL